MTHDLTAPIHHRFRRELTDKESTRSPTMSPHGTTTSRRSGAGVDRLLEPARHNSFRSVGPELLKSLRLRASETTPPIARSSAPPCASTWLPDRKGRCRIRNDGVGAEGLEPRPMPCKGHRGPIHDNTRHITPGQTTVHMAPVSVVGFRPTASHGHPRRAWPDAQELTDHCPRLCRRGEARTRSGCASRAMSAAEVTPGPTAARAFARRGRLVGNQRPDQPTTILQRINPIAQARGRRSRVDNSADASCLPSGSGKRSATLSPTRRQAAG